MIGIKRSMILLATGAAIAVSGSVGANAAPAPSPSTIITPAIKSENGITEVRKRGKHGGKHHYRGGHRGRSNLWWGAPLLAAPFLYNGYNDWGDYSYSGYGYRSGGGNSCYRACRYEHGPRFCRYNWEDYC